MGLWAAIALALSCGRAVQDQGASSDDGVSGNGPSAGSGSGSGGGGGGGGGGGDEASGVSGTAATAGSGSGASAGRSSGSGASAGSGGGSGASAGSGSVGGAGSSGVELAPGQCAVERACPGSESSNCIRCLLHADRACGGPVPRPGDCISDADCAGDNVICSVAPCEHEHCIAGCLTADDCEPSHDCNEHHCVPRACSADSGCSANFDCQGGVCARRACLSSLECHGFCVLDVCQELAGHCANACLP